MATRHPIPLPPLTQEIEAKLIGRLSRAPSGCWEWLGAKNRRGYGNIVIGGRHFKTHRVAYALFCGPITDGLEVCHDCPGRDNPACCNPTHLFLGTHADNMKDAVEKGTCLPPPHVGVDNSNTHLDESTVRLIRALAAEGKAKGRYGWRKPLAERFRISEQGIYRIVTRKLWGHVQ